MRNLAPRTITNATMKFFSFLILVYLARTLGPTQVGYFSVVFSVAGVAGVFIGLGIPYYMQKAIPSALAKGDHYSARSVFYSALRVGLIIFSLAVLGSLILHFLDPSFFGRAGAWNILVLALPFAVIAYYSSVGEGVFIASESLHRILHVEILREILRFLFVVVLVSVFRNYIAAVSGYILAYFFFDLTVLHLAPRLLPWLRGDYSVKIFSVVRSALPYLFFSIATMFLVYTDTIMLAYLRPMSDVGIYRVAMSAISATLALLPFTVVSMPTLSRHASQGTLRSAYRRILRGALSISLAAIPFLYLFAPYIIPFVFGSQFSPSVGVFYVLLWLLPLKIVYNLNIQSIVALGRDKEQIVYPLLAGALNVVLNYFFILRWGIYGAAAATVLSLLFATVLSGVRLISLFRKPI